MINNDKVNKLGIRIIKDQATPHILFRDKISDAKADELSFEISQRIQTEMTYPGQVKVTLIREKRAVNYAK